MNNLEIIFGNIKLKELETIIFKELNFDKGKVISSHFYDDLKKRDVELEMIPSLETFYNIPGTGNIYMKEVNLGICIHKVMTIISFDNIVGDIVLNFEESELFQDNTVFNSNFVYLIKRLQLIIDMYDIDSIVIGYEPASDEDMQLVTFTKQGIEIAENRLFPIMNKLKDIINSIP